MINNQVPDAPSEKAHLDGGVRWLSSPSASLDAAPQALGLPLTGGEWLLWGGGATLVRPQLRLQVSAWTGGLSAVKGSDSSAWDLDLAEVVLEQTYPQGLFLITAGASGDYGQLRGRLSGPGGHSSVFTPLWGGGVNAGIRWPRGTALGFFARSSYIWMSGQGAWAGDQAAALGTTTLDLSGASVTGQIELSF